MNLVRFSGSEASSSSSPLFVVSITSCFFAYIPPLMIVYPRNYSDHHMNMKMMMWAKNTLFANANIYLSDPSVWRTNVSLGSKILTSLIVNSNSFPLRDKLCKKGERRDGDFNEVWPIKLLSKTLTKPNLRGWKFFLFPPLFHFCPKNLYNLYMKLRVLGVVWLNL